MSGRPNTRNINDISTINHDIFVHGNNPSRKIPYLVEFDETPRFWYHVELSMRGPTLPFSPTKTYDPISVDLRKKRKKSSFFSLSLSLSSLFSRPSYPSLPSFPFFISLFFFFLSFFFPLFFKKFGSMAPIAPCVHLSFGYVSTPKQFIYFQFNLF